MHLWLLKRCVCVYTHVCIQIYISVSTQRLINIINIITMYVVKSHQFKYTIDLKLRFEKYRLEEEEINMGYVCLLLQSYNALHKAHQLVSLYFWILTYGLTSIKCPYTKVTRRSTNTERTFEQIWIVSSTLLLFTTQTITWNSLIL